MPKKTPNSHVRAPKEFQQGDPCRPSDLCKIYIKNKFSNPGSTEIKKKIALGFFSTFMFGSFGIWTDGFIANLDRILPVGGTRRREYKRKDYDQVR